jgi:hypothetical protein
MVGLFVLVVAPVQLLITVYVAGVLAVTSRWSPVAPANLAVGAGAGPADAADDGQAGSSAPACAQYSRGSRGLWRTRSAALVAARSALPIGTGL